MTLVATTTAIREATIVDVPILLAMFRRFIQTGAYRQYIGDNPARAGTLVTFLVTNPEATIFVSERDGTVVGMFGIWAYDHPMSGERIASETFWWLDPDHRGYGGWLLRRGERWARAHGAARIQMMAPVGNARVRETYEALGYSAVEVIFQKDVR